jgi:methionine salvage enolase-phosphatase E1
MLPLFREHFDTAVGAKVESSSYETIFKTVKEHYPSIEKAQVLFGTDNILEAQASLQARTPALNPLQLIKLS